MSTRCACGRTLRSHPQCWCGQLAGPGHELPELPCPTCARRSGVEPVLVMKPRPRGRNAIPLDDAGRARRRTQKAEYQRHYRQTHREQVNATSRLWRKNNPDRRRQSDRVYAETHLAEVRAARNVRGQRFREKHRERLREQAAIYRERNRLAIRARDLAARMANSEEYRARGRAYWHGKGKQRRAARAVA